MLPNFLNDAHIAEAGSDDSFGIRPPLLLGDPQQMNLPSSSSHVAFTLSNSLVQFLSPLQLQGFASRLIETFGLRHMDELAARVTCEDDVDALLGPHASLQQRRELWKGVCKWKRTANKRGREWTKKSDKKKAVVDGNSRDTDVMSEKMHRSTTRYFIDLEKCTPSQFIRQFAFDGYKESETCLAKQQPAEICISNAVGTATEGADNCSAPGTVISSPGAPSRSLSRTSSVSTLEYTHLLPEKRYRREKLPVSTLSMGPGTGTAGGDEFLREWRLYGDDAEPKRDSVHSSVPSEAEGVVQIGELIEECCAEHEAMRVAMCGAMSSAVVTYNEGLRALQEKLRRVLAVKSKKRRSGPVGSDVSAPLERAARIVSEPPLRVEMHPAESQWGEIVSFHTHVKKRSLESIEHVNKRHHSSRDDGGGGGESVEFCAVSTSVEPNTDNMRPSSPVNAIIVSSPSGNMIEDAMPSLSDFTSPSRGSYRHTEALAREEYTRQHGIALQNPPDGMPRLTNYDKSQAFPAVLQLEEEIKGSFPANGWDEGVADGTTECGEGTGAEEVLIACPSAVAFTRSACGNVNAGVTSQDLVEPCGAFSLDDFGLQAVSKEVNHSALGDAEKPVFVGEVLHGASNLNSVAVESQVIDVDAISSLESFTKEGERSSRRHQNNDYAISVDDGSEEMSTHSSPMALKGGFSAGEHVWMCSQLPRERQRAVSRSSSLSTSQESGNDYMDSLSISVSNRARGMNWTTTSSMAADMQNLLAKSHQNEEKKVQLQNDASNVDEEHTVMITATRAPSPHCLLAPQGLPPLPSRNLMNKTPLNAQEPMDETIEELTSERVMKMSYDVLRQWCLRLGLRIVCDEAHIKDAEEQEFCNVTDMDVTGKEDNRDIVLTQGENSSGWWLMDSSVDINEDDQKTLDGSCSSHSPQRHPINEGNGTRTPPTFALGVDSDELEWRDLQRAAVTEQMQEALRLFITRRKFMLKVVPFFFHRLPRFSGGDPYRPVRAAELVKTQLALTRQELEEQRRLAKKKEAEEVVCCIITSLAADAAESIERQAFLPVKEKNIFTGEGTKKLPTSTPIYSSQTTCNAAYAELPVYDQLLLMEPTDVQAAATVVHADFPHVSKHRVETLLEESGIPIKVSRHVCNSQEVGGGELNATQRSASSCSPPPGSPTCTTQKGQTASTQYSKRRFFAQRGWAQQRRNT
ncbi:hypothetical protein C4B63_4g461 [Trypanosoma cruzi]|uniref:Uncharacterized protein n=1 Tax=Trypanosoma cruzi TaxID=5693 RepID=A0A2V2VYC6_TRYCR|nr:hypothetical protein C4B63_4g461 [Trypanosoma cruzi]